MRNTCLERALNRRALAAPSAVRPASVPASHLQPTVCCQVPADRGASGDGGSAVRLDCDVAGRTHVTWLAPQSPG